MTSRVVATVGSALLHDRTVALVVEPALADLQVETANGSSRQRAAAHRAAWVALGLAVWHDIAWDPRGPAWKRHAEVLATMCFLVVAYHTAMLTLILGFQGQFRSVVVAQLLHSASNGTLAMALLASFGAGVAWVVRRASWVPGP